MKRFGRLWLAILIVAASAGTSAAQWYVDVESGMVFSGYNDVRIPNKTGTDLSLTDDLKSETIPFARGRLGYTANGRHDFSLLIAPLTVKADGVIDKAVFFEGVEFPAGAALQATYTFNSYRLTYRYRVYRTNTIAAGIGFTAKIRDAAVLLESDTRKSEKTNVGFVPLINFHLSARIGRSLRVVLAGDALAAPQGRAEDVALTIQYPVARRWDLKAGYRLLEGGADVDEVYSFALFHYLFAGITVHL